MPEFRTPSGAPYQFEVHVERPAPDAETRRLEVIGPGPDGYPIGVAYELPAINHRAYLDLFDRTTKDFGLHVPSSRQPRRLPPPQVRLQPLLTRNISPKILYGYGDPSVIRLLGEDGEPVWYMLVTSNDAPDAFPILRSANLIDWDLAGFVFPEGSAPAWTLIGRDLADFWAPELHKVGDEFWVCFAARKKDRTLAVGLARGRSPEGPFVADDAPVISGGVIDPHIINSGEAPLLLWKSDDNDLWPPMLAELLQHQPHLIAKLFHDPADLRTICLVQAIWPWARTLEPMERYFLQQPMIEAITARFGDFKHCLEHIAHGQDLAVAAQAQAILVTLKTRIYAQPLSSDGKLFGERKLVLENDLPWEAHLIEGVWSVQHKGRSYLFYAGNDFSTPDYAIGAAVADQPLGPYRKLVEPLLRSTTEWWAPGHPSVAMGPDGRHRMFLHAFFPGQAGYKVFRACLMTPVSFEGDMIRLG